MRMVKKVSPIIDDVVRHSGRSAAKLSGESYDAIERLADNLGIPKYRKSLFRGISMRMDDPAELLSGILKNKSFRLSSFTGGNRHAESWSKSPETARKFSSKHSLGMVVEARPAAKDIVIDLSDKRIRNHAQGDGKSSLALNFSKLEKEVVVRTGERKYSFCRNIIYIRIKASVVAKSKKLQEELLRLTNEAGESLRYDMERIGRSSVFMFACKGGRMVYLPGRNAADVWFSKLKSK